MNFNQDLNGAWGRAPAYWAQAPNSTYIRRPALNPRLNATVTAGGGYGAGGVGNNRLANGQLYVPPPVSRGYVYPLPPFR